MAYLPTPNQSVSGAVTTQAGSVLTTAQLAGSVMAVSGSFTAPANQSVSGAVTTPPGSIVSVTNPAGSVTAVLATQVTSPWIVAPNNSSLFSLQPAGSILAVSGSFTPAANQSVSGAITAPPGSVMNVVHPAGSIGAVLVSQVTSPWIVAPNNSSLYSLQPAGSILAVSGSFTPAANQSVSGEVNVIQTTSPWLTNMGGSVIAVLQTSSLITRVTGSVVTLGVAGSIASVTNPAGSIGAVIAAQPAGSLLSAIQVAGSVMAVRTDSASIISVSTNVGSVISLTIGSIIAVVQANSIVGTYAEDAGHTTADKGLAVWGVRNDTVASFVSANLDYTPRASDSAGRTIIKPFISEDGTIISYSGSVVSGSVTLIQASAIGLRNYITDFWAVNTGATTTLITFADGSTSVLGYTIAPTGGGSNSPGIAIPLKTAPSQDLVFSMGAATSILYMTVKGYQAP